MSLIQATYWFAFIALLLFSWSRARGILHPHFMFCMMLTVLASDYMIRGDDNENLQGITDSALVFYQLATLATLLGVGFATAVVRQPYELAGERFRPQMRVAVRLAWALLAAGLAVVILHQILRLAAVDWSVDRLFEEMLGPRDTRSWDQVGADGTRDPVYQLLNGVYPLMAILFAFLMFSRLSGVAFSAAFAFSVAMFVLVTDGSRTQAIIPMVSLAIFGLMTFRSALAKTFLVAGVLALILAVTSAIILFRAQGLQNSSSAFALTYHQDDSIYRVWSAAAYADFSNYRWDPSYFFYYIVTLPIPRALWAGKPLIGEDFYGGFKLWYTTTTFMGEWISMLGVGLGFFVAFLFGIAVYRFFYWSQKLLLLPLGLPAYLLIALYTYMVMRSMPNLTIFVFAPAAALLLVWLASRSERPSKLAGSPLKAGFSP